MWLLYLTSLNMMNVQKVFLFNGQVIHCWNTVRRLTSKSLVWVIGAIYMKLSRQRVPHTLFMYMSVSLNGGFSPHFTPLLMIIFSRKSMEKPWLLGTTILGYNCTLGYTLKRKWLSKHLSGGVFWYPLCQVNKRQLGACLPKIKVLFLFWGFGEWTLISFTPKV